MEAECCAYGILMTRSDFSLLHCNKTRYLKEWLALGGDFRRRMARGGLKSACTVIWSIGWRSDDETSELQQMIMEIH